MTPPNNNVHPLPHARCPGSLSTPSERPRLARSTSPPEPCGPSTLLLVDGDEKRRAQTARLLARDDLSVIERATMPDVFAEVLASAPDMILVCDDHEGPGALEACRQLRLVDAFSSTPIVCFGRASGDDAIVEALGAGADDYVTEATSERELVARIGAQLRRRRDREALSWARAQRASFRALALTDPLTGVGNRRRGTRAIEDAVAQGRPMAVVMIDIDHFKRVNDTYGHDAGDEVLEAVARVLEHTVRGEGVVSRWGGEEFAIVLTGECAQRPIEIAELCRQAVAELRFNLVRRVTASVGVAERAHANEQVSAEEIVAMADAALYASKAGGRDRVTLAPRRAAAVESPWCEERHSEVRVALRVAGSNVAGLTGTRD